MEPLAGDALTEALAAIRSHVGKLKVELGKTKSAALPKADMKRLARAYAHDLAKKGAPKIEVRKGVFEATFHDPRLDVELTAMPALLAATMAWVDPDRLAQRLEAEIDAMPEPPLALSKTAQAKRLAEVEAELDGLERREEALIRQAALAGTDILRRPDASPAAVLGVKIARRIAVAA